MTLQRARLSEPINSVVIIEANPTPLTAPAFVLASGEVEGVFEALGTPVVEFPAGLGAAVPVARPEEEACPVVVEAVLFAPVALALAQSPQQIHLISTGFVARLAGGPPREMV